MNMTRSSRFRFPSAGLLLLTALFLAGCGEKEKVSEAPIKDAREEAKAYYAAHPEFFHFKTAADIPAGLEDRKSVV